MRITAATIRNYKSFREPPAIEFGSGFNIIVGRNNAGKTALIEALSLQFINAPHRSILTAPYFAAAVDPQSQITIRYELGREELRQLLIDTNPQFYVPIPSNQEFNEYT